MSHPHFLNADEQYQKGVVGLNPDPEKHLIHVDLETVIIINFFFKNYQRLDLEFLIKIYYNLW